jgi:CRP-like cAMP-binding protein
MTAAGPADSAEQQAQLSLSTSAARNLATTTKSTPQMQGVSSRWLLRLLPWVQASGGTYRVNRRLSFTVGDGRVTFSNVGTDVRVIPPELGELPPLRGFSDEQALTALADRFVQQEYAAGDVIVEAGQPVEQVFLLAHGKVNELGTSKYGATNVVDVLANGAHFGSQALTDTPGTWQHTMQALTSCTVLTLRRQAFQEMREVETFREHIRSGSSEGRARNEHGEAEISVAAGHSGEPALAGTFVDYELSPREYELSVAQTVLQVHTRVADLYNQPMDQTEQQLKLTIEALRERQEAEMINNPEFGLLHNADMQQRINTRSGPPSPDDMDELLALVWKDPGFFLAHPRTISAFGQECSRRGVYPQAVDVAGHQVPSWRGVPIFPCDKIGVGQDRTSSVLLVRTGEQNRGVVGLHQTGIPDEYEPGLSVRFMGINEQAVIRYLVSTYYSAAILVPDAVGVLENVELGVQS